MRKSIVFIVVFLLITLISKAQSEYYYLYDKVRNLTENASIYPKFNSLMQPFRPARVA